LSNMSHRREHLVSGRLIFYRPGDDDIKAIFDIHADPDTNRFNPHGPMKNEDEAWTLLHHWQAEWDEKQWGYWSIALRSDPDRIIGFGGISNRPRFGGTDLVEHLRKIDGANLYFRFSPQAWGQGYAIEMAEKALETAFVDIGLKTVLGLTRETNKPSRKILERLGLKFIGMSSDQHELGAQCIYAMNAENFRMKSA